MFSCRLFKLTLSVTYNDQLKIAPITLKNWEPLCELPVFLMQGALGYLTFDPKALALKVGQEWSPSFITHYWFSWEIGLLIKIQGKSLSNFSVGMVMWKVFHIFHTPDPLIMAVTLEDKNTLFLMSHFQNMQYSIDRRVVRWIDRYLLFNTNVSDLKF